MAAAAAVALAPLSCGRAVMKLPTGANLPAADGASVVMQATAACAAVSTLTAQIAVNGSVGGRRLRGTLLAGFGRPASARLEAVAPFGQPLFILAAENNSATLLLPRDNRVLPRAPSDAVLEAIAGVPVDAAGLRTTLTGCAAPNAAATKRFGDDWRSAPAGDTDVYFQRDGRDGMWQLVAAVHHDAARGDWRAEFRDFSDGLPRTIRLISTDSKRFDLRLALSQVETNVPLGSEAFTVMIPREATPITLDDLRSAGPLAPQTHAR
jgi:hypothetical protein